jgi:hypothetical protein
MLFQWCSNKGFDFSQFTAVDLSCVANQMCRTWGACKQKLRSIQNDGLATDEKSGLITKWSNEKI